MLKHFAVAFGIGLLISGLLVPGVDQIQQLILVVASGVMFILGIFLLFAEGEDYEHTN